MSIDFSDWKRCSQCLKELHPSCFHEDETICGMCVKENQKAATPVKPIPDKKIKSGIPQAKRKDWGND